jgi:zinc transport system substrate-binding protein
MLLASAVLGSAMLLPGCAGDESDSSGDRLAVLASFYPLEFLVSAVGGDHVAVTPLTPPGAEPHDLELSPAAVADVADADLVVYLSGFQPAVDDAVAESGSGHVLDVARAARLTHTFTPIEEGEEASEEAGSIDPHFWLDPDRASDVAGVIEEQLASADPDHATSYAANLTELRRSLTALDAEYRRGLESCERPDLVTSHNAFGYLAERYGLRQVGITGLTPEAEPTPDQLAAVSAYVTDHHVTTIYFETLVSPSVAETVASETGAATAVLDPIEGLTDESAGDDYLAVMRSNLDTLRRGQGCG